MDLRGLLVGGDAMRDRDRDGAVDRVPREAPLPGVAQRGELLRVAPPGWHAAAQACQLRVVAVVQRASGALHDLVRLRVCALVACSAWRGAALPHSVVPDCLAHVSTVELAVP